MSDTTTIISRLDEPIARLQAAIDGLAAAITGEKTGVAALQGKLPAEESDAEFLAQIEAEDAKGKPGQAGLTITEMARKAAEKSANLNLSTWVDLHPNGNSWQSSTFHAKTNVEAEFVVEEVKECVQFFAASVACAALDELVLRVDRVRGTDDLVRSIAAEMKGDK